MQFLQAFSHERKFYTRAELATHRRKGDPDDSSHRGHPLCQFCEVRFVDDEELFRHLRRDHYFCHFCDADGIQAYYPDYGMLKDHFKSAHFLCEEGDCVDEQFTHAFRTELDLKAHRLERHKLNKAESRQNRQVEVDLSFNRRQPRGQGYVHTPVTADQEVPDMTEDFPTLGGAKASKASQGAKANGNMANRLASSTGRNWASVNHHSAAFQEADFPSLPGAPPAAPQNQSNGPPPPSVKKKATKTPKETKQNPVLDFPSLPSSSQNQVHAFGPQYRRPNGYTPAWSSKQAEPGKQLDRGKKVAPAPDLDFPSLQPNVTASKPEKKSKAAKKLNPSAPESVPALTARASSSLRSAADLIFSSASTKSINNDPIAEKENVSKVNVVKELPVNTKRLAKPPPGFGGGNQHIKSKVIVPRKQYMQPADFNKRNAQLMSTIVQAFGGGKSLEFGSFKDLSHQYKENKIDSNDYLVQCSAILDNNLAKLESFMADLIVLLPQIDKQQVQICAQRGEN